MTAARQPTIHDALERHATATTRSGLPQRCSCGGTPGPTGECAECRRKRTLGLQTKLMVNEPGDRYEREADRVAEHVMRRPASMKAAPAPSVIQRVGTDVGYTASEAPPVVHEVLRSPGRPLDPSTRSFMEARFGHDFSRVRVHTGDRATESARALGARAYTVGQDVAFDAGQYRPETNAGRHLLAHELAHTVQQRQAREYLQRYSTQECTPADTARIDESHARAIEMLEQAVRRLEADPVTAETQRHFANHFGGYGSWRRDIVTHHFKRDLDLLRGNDITYECEANCDEGKPAYTYWIFGDIHICLPWLRSEGLNERGETFIHEMHHWDVPRGHLDLGYHKNNADNDTSWLVAVNNADAYSELAQDLYEQS